MTLTAGPQVLPAAGNPEGPAPSLLGAGPTMDRIGPADGRSDGADRRCLRAAVAVLDVEFDPLPLFEAAVAIHLDSGEVHEHIPATVDRDEAVALVRVEPLDGALSHCPTTP